MKRIRKLDPLTINQISAGEVVDRPASVVKELIENALDAQSTRIIIEIREGGKRYIRVTDNGTGIHKDDVDVIFERHATSKIKKIDDLQSILSLGFRGEALASIASVSQVELITRTEDHPSGLYLRLHGGILEERKEIGCPIGTTLIVNHLFYNTPARAEFLKSNTAEAAYISDLIAKYALAYPQISFRFIKNDEIIFNTPGGGNTLDNIKRIYGTEVAKNLYALSEENEDISLKAYISKPSFVRGNKKLQVFFVNGRYIKDKTISNAIEQAYKSLVMVNKFPICFIYLNIKPDRLDVNIHPAKAEIRFKDEQLVQKFVFNALRKKLFEENLIPHMPVNSMDSKQEEERDEEGFDTFSETSQIQLNFENDVKEQDGQPSKKDTDYSDQKFSQMQEKKSTFLEDNPSYLVNNKNDSMLKSSRNFMNIEKEQKERKTFPFPDIKISDQIFQTYLIGHDQDNLYLIDQHGAHERILYDYFVEKYEKQSVISQTLLTPLLIELSFREFELVKEHLEIFSRLGFEVQEFGFNSIILRSVPMIFGEPEAKEFFLEVLNSIEKEFSSSSVIKADKVISMACKNAVKAKDRLAKEEIDQLMKQLALSPNPFTCPHGRPIILSITKKEIEKRFRRI